MNFCSEFLSILYLFGIINYRAKLTAKVVSIPSQTNSQSSVTLRPHWTTSCKQLPNPKPVLPLPSLITPEPITREPGIALKTQGPPELFRLASPKLSPMPFPWKPQWSLFLCPPHIPFCLMNNTGASSRDPAWGGCLSFPGNHEEH